MEAQTVPTGVANRRALRARIDQLIERLRAGDVDGVRDLMHNRHWRDGLEAAAVDSGQLGYADDLLEEGHTILRQTPTDTAAAIEKLERARGRLE